MTIEFVKALHTVQVITFVIVIATLAMISSIMIIDKKNALKQIGFVMWLVHGAVFYFAFSQLTPEQMISEEASRFYTGWSAALRLHGYVTLFVIFLDLLLHLLDKRYGFTPRRLLKKILRRQT